MRKNFKNRINFLCQIKILLLKMKKILKIPSLPGFLKIFVQNSRFFQVFFCLNCQIPVKIQKFSLKINTETSYFNSKKVSYALNLNFSQIIK